MINKLRCIILALVLIVSIAPICNSEVNDKVKIGVSTPLSGDLSAVGTDIKNAIVFANKKLLNNKYDLIIEDDRCDKREALSIAHRFSSIHKIKYVLGMLCNGVLLSSAPQYVKSKTLVLSAGATSGDVEDIGEGIFRPYPADNLAINAMIPHMLKNVKSLGVIREVDEYAMLMERSLVRENKKLPKINKLTLYLEQVAADNKDFKTTLIKLKSKGVEGIFYNARSEAGYIDMIKQSEALGLKVIRYANMFPSAEVVKKALGKLDEGTIFTNVPFDLNSLSKVNKTIYKDFVNEYGMPPNATPIFFSLGIDTMLLRIKL